MDKINILKDKFNLFKMTLRWNIICFIKTRYDSWNNILFTIKYIISKGKKNERDTL